MYNLAVVNVLPVALSAHKVAVVPQLRKNWTKTIHTGMLKPTLNQTSMINGEKREIIASQSVTPVWNTQTRTTHSYSLPQPPSYTSPTPPLPHSISDVPPFPSRRLDFLLACQDFKKNPVPQKISGGSRRVPDNALG